MPTTNQTIGQQLLYPLDDPATAFENAMREAGLNPAASNPFIAQLKKAAQGSRISFLANNMGTPVGGADPQAAYGDWLKSQISGGGLLGSLSDTAGRMPQVVQGINDYETRLKNGGTPSMLSPYAAALKDIFASNNGQGGLGAYASLVAPRLGNGLASSFTSGVQAQGDSNFARYAKNADPNASIFDWLFGYNNAPTSSRGGLLGYTGF